jgi:hypothetical protein
MKGGSVGGAELSDGGTAGDGCAGVAVGSAAAATVMAAGARSPTGIAAPADTNFGSKRVTSKQVSLVPLFDLKFLA